MSPQPSATVKILEKCKVSPPPYSSSPTTTIPLTFFDIPWLFFSPTQPLFFYEYRHPTSHFLSDTIPLLKHSLSLTLQHFFPFSANLVLPSLTTKPAIVSTSADFVTFTAAESSADFHRLIGNHPRDVHEFYSFVPELPTGVADVETDVLPLLSVKVTIMPMYGLCIGLAYHYAVADGRTFNNFIKTWASLSRSTGSRFSGKLVSVSYDRTVIIDRNGLEETFLKEWLRRKSKGKSAGEIGAENDVVLAGLVRATFVIGWEEMDKIKTWIISECKKRNLAEPVHLSPYVLVCSFVWVCLVKTITQGGKIDKFFPEDPTYFGFNAGGLTRLDFRVPASYFGNCIGFGRCKTSMGDLLGEDGLIVAANAIGNKIKTLDKAMLKGAEKWISEWEELIGSDVHVMVCGSPKVDVYKTDFGWGRPKKIEEIGIDKKRAISLAESREKEGGMEVGLALRKREMEDFTCMFNLGLKSMG